MRAAINIPQSLFMDDDGSLYPITDWFDADGEPSAPEEAVVAVAGEGGCWFSLQLDEFHSEGGRLQ